MLQQPILSIVIPTIGNFSEYWLQQLLEIKGNVEFILVYPPEFKAPVLDDVRVKILWSLYKGETPQRAFGLLNATGQYVIALDDDDFLHPDVLRLSLDYFEKFPESWFLRLNKEDIDYSDEEKIKRPWSDLPSIDQLNISKKPNDKFKDLVEVPIAPLENAFDPKMIILIYAQRKDIHGTHVEPFNNIVWKNDMVQESVIELMQTGRMADLLTWLPLWGLDRALGLFIQAKFFESGRYIGHWMPEPGQVRYIVRPVSMKTPRLLILVEAMVVKAFPQYGYLWNMFFEGFYDGIRIIIKSQIRKYRDPK